MRTGASEEFATRVEHALRPGAGTSADGDEQSALVTLAVDLRDATRPLAGVVPRQEFRAELAERLAVEARALEPARRQAARSARGAGREPVRTHEPHGSERRRRARAVVAGLVALVVAGGAGAAVASESALPGGLLYPLKRQVEDLRLQLSSPGSARGGTELALARERLVEAEDLALAAGGADVPATDTPQLRATLDDFGSSALAGIDALTQDYARTGDATSLAAVATFLDETVPLLERLRTMTPRSLHPVIDDLLADLGERRTELAGTVASCAACHDLGLVVAVPPASDPAVPALPGATAVPLPDPPTTLPPTGAGTGGGVLDPLDPVTEPLPLDPVQTLIDDLLPEPQPNPTSTPLLPLPPLLPTEPPGSPSSGSPSSGSPSSGSTSTCLLPLLGCD